MKLISYPALYRCVSTLLDFLKSSSILESSSFRTLRDPTVPDNHRTKYIVLVFEAKEHPSHHR